MKRNRKYNKNLVQENLMNGLRHIVFILIIGFAYADVCDDDSACNYGDTNNGCEYPEEGFDCAGNCWSEFDCSGVCAGDNTSCWTIDEELIGTWNHISSVTYPNAACGGDSSDPEENENWVCLDTDIFYNSDTECSSNCTGECHNVSHGAPETAIFEDNGTIIMLEDTGSPCEEDMDCQFDYDSDNAVYVCGEETLTCIEIINAEWGIDGNRLCISFPYDEIVCLDSYLVENGIFTVTMIHENNQQGEVLCSIDQFELECGGDGPVEGLTCDGTPIEFVYNQSILQAFYYFTTVTINGIAVEPDDWVGAFRDTDGDGEGDICVGSRSWDTSNCGEGVCDFPVMGNDGLDGTAGYMQMGDIPTFKIYDASENTYYDAVIIGDITDEFGIVISGAWLNLEFYLASLNGCEGEMDECGVCDGDGSTCGDDDCIGNCCVDGFADNDCDGYCDCCTIANNEDCNNSGCYWEQTDDYPDGICLTESEANDGGDDGLPECIFDCPDFQTIFDFFELEEGDLTPNGICVIVASWDGDSCLSDCSDECDGCDYTELEEVMGMVGSCSECLANDNCEEMMDGDECDSCHDDCYYNDDTTECHDNCEENYCGDGDGGGESDCMVACGVNEQDLIDAQDDVYEICAIWAAVLDNECLANCSADAAAAINEYASMCTDCINDVNCEEMMEDEDGPDCEDWDNQEDCENDDGCSWDGSCYEIDCPEGYDCYGECGGEAEVDCAGECGGSAVEDCAGVCDGVTPQNYCDACESGIFDCAGICNGNLLADNCGVCDSDPSNDNTVCWFVDLKAKYNTTSGPLFDNNSRLGMHIAAKDGYYTGYDTLYSNTTYQDVFDVNIALPFDQLDLYFPHSDWEDEIPDAFFGNTDFEDDIRKWFPSFALDSLDIDNPILVNEQIYLAQKNKIWNLTVFSDGENLIGQDSVVIQFDITNQLPDPDYLKAYILMHDASTDISIIEEIQDDGMFTINNFGSPTQLTIFIGTEDIIPSVNIISPIPGEIFSVTKEELEISVELENPDMIQTFEIFFEVDGNYSDAISVPIELVEESVLTIDKDQYYSHLNDLMDGNYLDNVDIHIEIIDIADGHVEDHEEHHYHVSVGPLTFSGNTSTTELETGWHLLSPPLAGIGGNHDLVGEEIFYNDAYDCTDGCTILQTANSGTGFYVESNGENPNFTFNGEVLSDFSSPLQQGWNLIGNPLVTPVDINSLIITYNNTDLSWWEASDSLGIISPTPIIYDNGRGSHVGTESISTAQGFWVHSFYDDVEISFIPSNPAPEIEPSLYWNLSLFARENTENNGANYDESVGSEIVIGIHEDANNAIVEGEDQEAFPLSSINIFDSYTGISINNDDLSSIYKDIRSFHKDSLTWDISVDSFQPFNSGAGIKLTWTFNNDNEPYDYYLNTGNGTLINMKGAPFFVIAYQNDFINGMSITAELKDEYTGCTSEDADNENEIGGEANNATSCTNLGGEWTSMSDGSYLCTCAGGECLGGNEAVYCEILALIVPDSYNIDPTLINQSFEIPVSLTNPQFTDIEGLEFIIEYDSEMIQLNSVNLHENLAEYEINQENCPDCIPKAQLRVFIHALTDNIFAGADTILFISGNGLEQTGTTTLSLKYVQINESQTSFGNECQITIGISFIDLSGELFYYSNSRSVPGSQINLISNNPLTPSYSAITDNEGNFYIEDIVGENTYTLTLSKGEYNGSDDDYFDGLSAVDASRIARHAANFYELIGNEQLAANVNFDYRCEYDAEMGSGAPHYTDGISTTEFDCGQIAGVSWMPNIEAGDATKVAKYAAGINNYLDLDCNRHWIFIVQSDSLMFDPETCTESPYIMLADSSVHLSFEGIRLGDVTGNWSAPLSRQNEDYFADNPMVEVESDEIIKLPIYLPNNVEIEGIDLTIQYDPEVFSLIGYSNRNSILEESTYPTIINEETPGIFKLVSYANSTPIYDNGLLGYIKFKVVSQTTAHSTISMVEMEVNEIPEGGFLIVDGIDSGNISRGFDFQIIAVPDVFALNQNYPNPFNPSTNIQFELPFDGDVEIFIYDLKGSLIDELMNGYMEAGYHQIKWDGSRRSSGMYFIRMIADNGNYIKMSKMMLVK